jgi:hypothetical protein
LLVDNVERNSSIKIGRPDRVRRLTAHVKDLLEDACDTLSQKRNLTSWALAQSSGDVVRRGIPMRSAGRPTRSFKIVIRIVGSCSPGCRSKTLSQMSEALRTSQSLSQSHRYLGREAVSENCEDNAAIAMAARGAASSMFLMIRSMGVQLTPHSIGLSGNALVVEGLSYKK